MNDPMWGLYDGGVWKSQNKYPVYAVAGQTGALMMHHLGKYSGNMTDVENGQLLTELYDSRDYVRLYTVITTGSPASLPSLWVFLLIILGILLAIIAVTSLLMHYIQRRHRQALRRRVANGEVDLEALGIKRLTVPQEVVDRMPLFVYVASDDEILERPKPSSPTPSDSPPHYSATPLSTPLPTSPTLTSPAATDSAPHPISTPQSSPTEVSSAPTTTICQSKSSNHQTPFSQPSCPICLEDFTSHSTTVRELPCAHIFHPECVDSFLRVSSSLCPMCKKSVLPKGYCPTNVTNAMVRRERLLRRMRERITIEVVDTGSGAAARSSLPPVQHQRSVATRRRMPSFHREFGRAARANAIARRMYNAPLPPASTTVEMVQASTGTPLPSGSRTERAPHTADAILGTQLMTIGDEDRERQARAPKCMFSPYFFIGHVSGPFRCRLSFSVWHQADTECTGRKAVESVFPGFR